MKLELESIGHEVRKYTSTHLARVIGKYKAPTIQYVGPGISPQIDAFPVFIANQLWNKKKGSLVLTDIQTDLKRQTGAAAGALDLYMKGFKSMRELGIPLSTPRMDVRDILEDNTRYDIIIDHGTIRILSGQIEEKLKCTRPEARAEAISRYTDRLRGKDTLVLMNTITNPLDPETREVLEGFHVERLEFVDLGYLELPPEVSVHSRIYKKNGIKNPRIVLEHGKRQFQLNGMRGLGQCLEFVLPDDKTWHIPVVSNHNRIGFKLIPQIECWSMLIIRRK